MDLFGRKRRRLLSEGTRVPAVYVAGKRSRADSGHAKNTLEFVAHMPDGSTREFQIKAESAVVDGTWLEAATDGADFVIVPDMDKTRRDEIKASEETARQLFIAQRGERGAPAPGGQKQLFEQGRPSLGDLKNG